MRKTVTRKYNKVVVSFQAENNTLTQLLVYILAGSGFQKFDTVVNAWNATWDLEWNVL